MQRLHREAERLLCAQGNASARQRMRADTTLDDIVGITTPDGLVLGVMNHPERAIHRAVNLVIFENGVHTALT